MNRDVKGGGDPARKGGSFGERVAEQAEARQRMREIMDTLTECGINSVHITETVMERLMRLHEMTRTFKDERRAVEFAIDLQIYLIDNVPERQPTGDQMDAIFGGTFFTDIGKTGPADATPEQSMAVTRLYGVDLKWSPKKSAAEFVDTLLSGDIDKLLTYLESINFQPEGETLEAYAERFIKEHVDRYPEQPADALLADLASIERMSSDMDMRDFWDAHVYWSYDLIKDSDLPEASKIAAASHHILEGNFPPEVIDETGRIVGTDDYIGLPEAWVMMLDKYDAQRNRAGATHDEAILWLSGLEQRESWSKLDTKVQEILDQTITDIDVAMGAIETRADEAAA